MPRTSPEDRDPIWAILGTPDETGDCYDGFLDTDDADDLTALADILGDDDYRDHVATCAERWNRRQLTNL